MTSKPADMDRDDEWGDASEDEWGEGWDDVWDEEPLDSDDLSSFIVPLLLELLGGGGSGGDLPPVEIAAAQGVAAPYFQTLLHLVELLGHGAVVENMFMPPQPDADRIAEALGLSSERSRADLMTLWLDALVAQMVRVADGRATPRITAATLADMPVVERLRTARTVGVSKVSEALEAGPAYASVLYLLVGSFVADRAWLSVGDAVPFGASRVVYGEPYDDYNSREAATDLDEALDTLVGMAVVERDSNLVRLTEFGDRVLNEWIEQQLEF